jgi:hypothetical protein
MITYIYVSFHEPILCSSSKCSKFIIVEARKRLIQGCNQVCSTRFSKSMNNRSKEWEINQLTIKIEF